MDVKAVVHLLVRILGISAVVLLSCIPVALIYHEAIEPFVKTMLLAAGAAAILYLSGGRSEIETFGRREAYLSVSLSWLIISLVGAMPYLWGGSIPSFVDAFFESVSGFTTTGSSILTDIEALPKSVLYWRSMTHWIGGLGIIVLVIVIMPSLKIGGYNLFTLESSFQEKIHPRIKQVVVYLFDTDFAGDLVPVGRRNEPFRECLPCIRNGSYGGILSKKY